MRSACGRDRDRRIHAHHRMEAHEALPAPAAVRPSGARRPGRPGTMARADHRRVVTVSDRPADRPVPPLARASARKRAYAADGTNDGTSAERHAQAPRPAMTGEEREAIRQAGAGRGAALTSRAWISRADRRPGSSREARCDPARHSRTPATERKQQ